MNVIAFKKVKEPNGWMSNMAPFPIDIYGKVWRTSEALFQALRFSDNTIREEIRNKASPMAAKMASKKRVSEMIIAPQSEDDIQNMRFVLRAKLAEHPGLKIALQSTGDATIIEDCTSRQHGSGLFWGAALIDGEWKGENMLGKLWMELRDSLPKIDPAS